MASGRAAIRMTDAEVDAFLRDQRKLQVATNGVGGVPHLTTLFHVVHDGRLAFWTYGRSQKVRNLERDPRIACLVEDGEAYAELRGVSVTGTAEVVRDPATVLEVGTAVGLRMLGVPSYEDLGDLAGPARAEVERQAAKRVAVLVTAQHVASWDHSRLG